MPTEAVGVRPDNCTCCSDRSSDHDAAKNKRCTVRSCSKLAKYVAGICFVYMNSQRPCTALMQASLWGFPGLLSLRTSLAVAATCPQAHPHTKSTPPARGATLRCYHRMTPAEQNAKSIRLSILHESMPPTRAHVHPRCG